MGLFDHYRRFDGETAEDRNRRLRLVAEERRSKALGRVEPIDCSRTTSFELPHTEVVAALVFAARRGLNRYADGRDEALRQEIARRHRVSPSRVSLGEGAARLISGAAHAVLEPGDEVLSPWPSYPLYPLLARETDATFVPVEPGDPAAIVDAVTPRTRLLLLCNPNDPTGDLLPAATIEAILERLPPRVIVIVDEALRDYVDREPLDATIRLTDRRPGLLVVRTMSKAWSLAGLRCGYAIGGPDAGDLLAAAAPRLGLGDLSLAGALAALKTSSDLVAGRAAIIRRERDALAAALEERGALVRPSQTQALWVREPGADGPALHARLARAGVLTQAGHVLGDPTHVRISVRDAVASRRVLAAFGAS